MRIRLKHQRLAEIIGASRLSQNHWALRIGISRGHFSDLLKGRHPYVSFRTRQKLLEVLGVPFDELFEEERPASVPPIADRNPVPQPPTDSPNERRFMTTFRNDLRYAFRVCLRHRLVSATVVATLALGIAVTSAVFGIVQAVILAPLPFSDSEQVVRFGMTLRDGRRVANMAIPDVEDFRRYSETLSALTAVRLSGVTITGDGNPDHQMIAYVDHAYDDVFSVRPLHGRFFESHEYTFGSPRVVVLFHALWRDRFGADPSIVGKTIQLEHQPTTVVGVLPPMAYTYPFPGLGFLGPLRPDPRSFHLNRGALWVRAAGRVKPGVSVEQASAEVTRLAAGIAERFPDANGGLQTWIESLHGAEVSSARTMLQLLTYAVAAVLLVACVNVANLLLGQAQKRQREFAIRAALGGRAPRLRVQILTESLLLASAGGVLGLMLSPLTMRAIVELYPGELPRAAEATVGSSMVVVAVGLTILAGVLTGLPLARRAVSMNLVRDLRDGTRATTASAWTGRLLIASQVALSLALVFAALLLIKTLRVLINTDPGFETSSVSTFQVSAPPARYRDADAIHGYFGRVVEALQSLPGVSGVATSSDMPYTGNMASDVFVMKGRGDLGNDNPQARIGIVNPSYWSVMGTPILAGRPFEASDRDGTPGVVVVNEALARRYYPGLDPVGRQIEFNRQDWTIVGVSGSLRMTSMASPAEPQLYLPSAQVLRSARYVIVRSTGVDGPSAAELRHVLRGVDPTIAPIDVATMAERVQRVTAPERFRAFAVTSLGVIALLLSALGVYGVLADSVTRQAREIGIRMALGESSAHVRRRVVGHALATVCVGMGAGVALSAAAGQGLASVLVDVEPFDLASLAGATVALLLVCLVSAYGPASKASRVDPLIALRHDG